MSWNSGKYLAPRYWAARYWSTQAREAAEGEAFATLSGHGAVLAALRAAGELSALVEGNATVSAGAVAVGSIAATLAGQGSLAGELGASASGDMYATIAAGGWINSAGLVAQGGEVYTLQGGGGSSRRRTHKQSPRYAGKRKRIVEEVVRKAPIVEPPIRTIVEISPAEVRSIIVEAVQRALQDRSVPAARPAVAERKKIAPVAPAKQRIEPVGIDASWFGVPAVVEYITPLIKRRQDHAALLAAYHYFYGEAA